MKNNIVKRKLYILSIMMIISGYFSTVDLIYESKSSYFIIPFLIILLFMCLNYYIFKNGDSKLKYIPTGFITASYIFILYNFNFFNEAFDMLFIGLYIFFLAFIIYIIGLLIPYKTEEENNYIIKYGKVILTVFCTIIATFALVVVRNIGSKPNPVKHSFTTEVKNILEAANQQWVIDMSTGLGSSSKCYAHLSNTYDNMSALLSSTTELKLSGRDNLRYMICINKQGKITSFVATDNKYVISYLGTYGLNSHNIEEVDEKKTFISGSDIDGKASAKAYIISNTQSKTKAEIGTSGICTGEDLSDCSVYVTLK